MYKEYQWALKHKETGKLFIPEWDNLPMLCVSRKTARYCKSPEYKVVKVKVFIKEAA